MWEALSLAVLTSLAAADTVVQVNLGFFKEPAGHLWAYGVDAHSWTDVEDNVTFRFTFWPQTSGGKIIKKLQTGELDAAHLGNAPWGTGATRGIPAKMVYLIHSKDLSQVLVARQGLDGPQDFVGKRIARIAYIKGSTTHYMLQAFFAHSSVDVEDLDWVGHMDAKAQRDAWDKGEIDAGFMWGANMRYLQENEWCSKPDPSAEKYRPCAKEGKGKVGHNIFTAGMSRTWGAETWNNLVVRDHFLEAYPRAAARVVKVAATMDTKFVQDPGFLTRHPDRLCHVATAAGEQCDPAGLETIAAALGYDTWLEYAVQRSPSYLAERLPGSCAKETIPSTTGSCNRETMSGSAFGTWAISEFGYRLKFFPYLPPHKFYQDMMAPKFVGMVHTAEDAFPEITADALVAQHTTALVLESNPAYGFCGDLTQPIVLTQPGILKDHEGDGFHGDGALCEWHINSSQPVLLSEIVVLLETDQDNVYIYEGLCSLKGNKTCVEAPLLARFTGGKGTSQLTMENLNPRPPILVSGGLATVVFAPDDIADRPLGPVISDGLSLRWSVAPSQGCALPCANGGTCNAGRCRCVGGWAGADCSSPCCMGTVLLTASADTPGTLLNGVPGLPSGHNADCRWVLTTELPGHVIAVEIKRLDLDWTYDPVAFYDGDSIEAATLAQYSGYAPAKLGVAVGSRCPGPACPGAAISSGGVLTVRWTSDSMHSGDGFELIYRSVGTSSATCGVGPVSACSGHGACVATGCTCQDGWYGPFCQFSQCEGRTDVPPLAQGRISTMGPNEVSYAPLRNCSWVVRPPADEAGRIAGAIAFWIEVFDLEATASPPSTISSSAGDWLMVGGHFFNASNPPCMATSPCWAASNLSEAASCNCSTAVVVPGIQAEVRFKSDLNNYPRDRSFHGVVLRYEAVYDCPRDNNGWCLSMEACEDMDMVAGRTACIHCKPGSVLRRGGGVGSYCHLCIPGRYQGYSQDFPDTPECQTCPAGKYAAFEGQLECAPCEAGHYCSIGTDHMEPCAAGTFTGANGSDSCERCAVGTYQEHAGRTACVVCESQTTTLVLAATQKEDCVCARGFAMGAPGGHPCGRCPPVGVECPGGGAPSAQHLDDTPRLLRGYMVMEGRPWEVYFCAKTDMWGDEYCSEGRSLYNASVMCGPGVAPKPQCSVCLEGYMSTDTGCKACPNNSGWLLLGKVLGGGSLFTIFLIYLYHKSNNRHSTGLLAVWSLLNLMQTIHVMSRMDLQWQPPLNWILAGLSEMFSIPGMVEAMLTVEVFCSVNAGFVPTFLIHVMIPLCVPLAYACIGVIAECIRRPLQRDKVINVVGKVFTGLMVSVSALAFSLFAATHMPNGRHMLKDYPAVELLSPEWWKAMPIGLLAVLVYCVLLLAGIIHVVIHAPKAVSNNPHFTTRYLFIFGATRPDCWWWIVPASLFAMGLNAVQALLSAVRNQLFLSALVVALFSAFQTYVRPLKFRANNVVEDCLKLSYMLILVLASSFVDESRVAPDDRRQLWHSSTILIIVIMCFAALSSLGVLSRHLFHQCCRPPGTQVAHILQMAMEFRHTAQLAGALPNDDFVKKAAALKDYDVHHLEEARRVLVSCFFMEQPGRHLWQQRLMPGSKFVCFQKGKAFRRLQTAIEDGTLDTAVKDNLSELLTLEQLQQDLVAETHSMPLSTLSSRFLPGARPPECFSPKRQFLGIGDVTEPRKPMSLEVLTQVVNELGSDLSKEQASKLAELLVVNASGAVTPEEASATLQGLVQTLGPEDTCRRSLEVLLHVTRSVEKHKSVLESERSSGTAEQAEPPDE